MIFFPRNLLNWNLFVGVINTQNDLSLNVFYSKIVISLDCEQSPAFSISQVEAGPCWRGQFSRRLSKTAEIPVGLLTVLKV